MAMAICEARVCNTGRSRSLNAPTRSDCRSSTPRMRFSIFKGSASSARVCSRAALRKKRGSAATSLAMMLSPVSAAWPMIPRPQGTLTPCCWMAGVELA